MNPENTTPQDNQNQKPLNPQSDEPRLGLGSQRVVQPTEAILKEQASPPPATPTPVSQPQPVPPEPPVQPQVHIASVYPEATKGMSSSSAPSPIQDMAAESDTSEFVDYKTDTMQLLIVSCLTALSFTFFIWLQLKFNGHLTASSGKFFSFFPYVLNIGNLLLLAIVGGIAAALIKSRTGYTSWAKALLLTFPGIALVGAFYVNYFTFALLWYSFLNSLPGWFNTWPWICITSAILLFLTYLLSVFILRRTKNRPSVGTACCLLLAVLLIGFVYLVKSIETHNSSASLDPYKHVQVSISSSKDSNSTSNTSSSQNNPPTVTNVGHGNTSNPAVAANQCYKLQELSGTSFGGGSGDPATAINPAAQTISLSYVAASQTASRTFSVPASATIVGGADCTSIPFNTIKINDFVTVYLEGSSVTYVYDHN